MARKKKKDEVENYFNNVANYQTEAEARAVTPVAAEDINVTGKE